MFDFIVLLLYTTIVTLMIRTMRPNWQKKNRIIYVEKTVWEFKKNVTPIKRYGSNVINLDDKRKQYDSNRKT